MSETSIKSIEFIPSNFKEHNFEINVGNVAINVQITKMEGCLYLWIGKVSEDELNDLSFALPSKYEKSSVVTKIIGSMEDTTSTNIAKRLSNKLGKPIYVSFNLPVDNLSLPGIEKKIHEEFQKNPDLVLV